MEEHHEEKSRSHPAFHGRPFMAFSGSNDKTPQYVGLYERPVKGAPDDWERRLPL